MQHEFSADDLAWFLDLCERLSIDVWIDGGWGVDALLGEQTRSHSDLDIMIQWKDLDVLVTSLTDLGFAGVHTSDRNTWNFVLGNPDGMLIDFHVFEFDGVMAIYGPREKGWTLTAESYSGYGHVNGRSIRCLTAEYQVKSHSGYVLTDKDFADVSALCERFGISLPGEYERWIR